MYHDAFSGPMSAMVHSCQLVLPNTNVHPCVFVESRPVRHGDRHHHYSEIIGSRNQENQVAPHLHHLGASAGFASVTSTSSKPVWPSTRAFLSPAQNTDTQHGIAALGLANASGSYICKICMLNMFYCGFAHSNLGLASVDCEA